MDSTFWRQEFEGAARRREHEPAPDWGTGIALPTALVRSLQRFQIGEDGDGVSLVAKSARAGDEEYLAAVRLFVAEEQRHARLLGRILAEGGVPTLERHWSDTVFVRLRRALGLRLELMTLMVAEVVALRYYRALRDGAPCPLLQDVAGRILGDEQRHVPFHRARLRQGLAHLPRPVRALVAAGWWLLLGGATVVVAIDHAAALRAVGVPPGRFVLDVAALFGPTVTAVLGAPGRGSADAAAREQPAQYEGDEAPDDESLDDGPQRRVVRPVLGGHDPATARR